MRESAKNLADALFGVISGRELVNSCREIVLRYRRDGLREESVQRHLTSAENRYAEAVEAYEDAVLVSIAAGKQRRSDEIIKVFDETTPGWDRDYHE